MSKEHQEIRDSLESVIFRTTQSLEDDMYTYNMMSGTPETKIGMADSRLRKLLDRSKERLDKVKFVLDKMPIDINQSLNVEE